MERHQQQPEQENAWSRGPTISSLPACRVIALRTAQDTMNQEDTQDHPRELGTATSATLKHCRVFVFLHLSIQKFIGQQFFKKFKTLPFE